MGSKIQLLDLPGIIEGAKDGKGRGKQVIGVARTCSLLLIILDVTKPLTHKRIIERELEGFGIRINKNPPNIKVTKKERGGASIIRLCDTPELDDSIIKSILHEYKMDNSDLTFNCNANVDDLIDALEGNRI